MSYELQYDSQDQIPEEFKDLFVEWKDGDDTKFIHAQMAEIKKELFKTQGDYTQLKNKQDTIAQKAKEEAAQELEDRIKTLQEKGNEAEANKLKLEQQESLIAELQGTVTEFETFKQEQSQAKLKGEQETLIGEVLKGFKPEVQHLLKDQFMNRIKTEGEAWSFTNQDGKAISDNQSSVIVEMLSNEDAYKAFVLPPESSGGIPPKGFNPDVTGGLNNREAQRAARRAQKNIQ